MIECMQEHICVRECVRAPSFCVWPVSIFNDAYVCIFAVGWVVCCVHVAAVLLCQHCESRFVDDLPDGCGLIENFCLLMQT